MSEEKKLPQADDNKEISSLEESKNEVTREEKEVRKKNLVTILEEIALNSLPAVIVGLISVRVAEVELFIDFIRGGDVLLISFLVLASSFVRVVSKRVNKGYKYLIVSAMIIVLMEYVFNYTSPFKSTIMTIIESIVAFLVSMVIAIISAIQEEE